MKVLVSEIQGVKIFMQKYNVKKEIIFSLRSIISENNGLVFI